MKTLLLAGAALSLFTLQAAAEPVYQWTGYYVGANAGYAFQASDGDFDVIFDGVTYTDELESFDAEGFLGGLQAGANYQWDSWVAGIEADIQFADISDDVTGPGDGSDIDGTYEASIDMDWFGTLRGRAGVALDRTLLYATGGLAFGGIDFAYASEDDSSNVTDLSSDDVEIGFVVGAGIEHKFADNWSVKAEYQYIDFGEIEVSGEETGSGDPVSAETDLSFHTVRLGFNYHF